MPVLPSYGNQSIDLHNKSIDWFLYERKKVFNGLIMHCLDKEFVHKNRETKSTSLCDQNLTKNYWKIHFLFEFKYEIIYKTLSSSNQQMYALNFLKTFIFNYVCYGTFINMKNSTQPKKRLDSSYEFYSSFNLSSLNDYGKNFLLTHFIQKQPSDVFYKRRNFLQNTSERLLLFIPQVFFQGVRKRPVVWNELKRFFRCIFTVNKWWIICQYWSLTPITLKFWLQKFHAIGFTPSLI